MDTKVRRMTTFLKSSERHGGLLGDREGSNRRVSGGKFREEMSERDWFVSRADGKVTIEASRSDYNTVRQHNSLDGVTPHEFTRTAAGVRSAAGLSMVFVRDFE